MPQHKTLNDVKSNAKSLSIDVLNARLAEGIDLSLMTKQAHWNLRGMQFIAVHEMLDKFRDELDEHVDTIAERVVQLGGTAFGTLQNTVAKTGLPAYPTDIFDVKDHLEALATRYGLVAKAARAAIDATDEAGDADTADIFTTYSRALDKALWFIEAHIKE